MSSSDADRARPALTAARKALAALVFALAAAGCTVRPLYGTFTASIEPGQPAAAQLASVEIRPVGDRVGQEVRNHLIFLLGGGAGQPADPAYRLDLATTAFASASTAVSTPRVSLEPTAGVVTVRSAYTLTDARTGEPVASGTRSMQAPYDIPAQEFAARRAVRDAENRAARELAELLRLVLAQDLERVSAAPRVVSGP